jgi:bifunctional polynucleotide phosphatase/kinase
MFSTDKKASFFVGDAAGRLADLPSGRQADHASSDLKFADNVGIQFSTPEVCNVTLQIDVLWFPILVQEYFLGKHHTPYTRQGFNVSQLDKCPCACTVCSPVPNKHHIIYIYSTAFLAY